MIKFLLCKFKINTLRSYITVVMTGTVMVIVLLCGAYFYQRTAHILTENQRQSVVQQLHQVNSSVADQINSINSISSIFLSNNLIRDAIEPSTASSSNKIMVEKQMDFLLINTYLWQENYIDTIYIFSSPAVYYTFSSPYQVSSLENNLKVLADISPTTTTLIIKTLTEDPNTLYFARNIYSSYNGQYIATIMIDINKKTWIEHFNKTMDSEWSVYLYHNDMEFLTQDSLAPYTQELQEHIDTAVSGEGSVTEFSIHDATYLIAAEKLPNWNITSAVSAPKNQLYEALTATLQTYLWVLLGITLAAILISFALSRAIAKPIGNMIYHINKITAGEGQQLPSLEMYSEFHDVVIALNHMLNQLNIYYEDNLEKQLLLKNAEIQELQAQMDPHFLFNTLNTIAWKAQMSNDEDVYQMVISLGELLKANVVTKESTFISLADELSYVKFYTYLQKMRFEDKISVEIQAAADLSGYYIPCLCIQPLVENSFVHGLEPKKGNGRLIINIIPHSETMEISVIDDGIGFPSIPDIRSIESSTEDSHTHIGLKNLDRRLFLLFGESARLHITSVPSVCTAISFTIPLKTEV